MEDETGEVGFIKYDGKAVAPGVLDAGKAGMALTGLDELLRFFNSKQAAELAKAEYDVPVRIREGSWEAVVIAGLSVFAMAYLGRAGNEMAKKDFEGVGLKDVFRKSLEAAVHLVRLVKHTSKLKGWLLENVRWRNNNSEVGIPNSQGQFEYFPAEYVQWYATMPPHFVKKIAEVVEEERTLTVGVFQNGVVFEEKITVLEKRIFTGELIEESDEEFLFPELEHGMNVKLEGRLVRGNADTNSIGLDYQGHNLNCVPEHGSIVQYKPALFLRCMVEGRVSRLTKSHYIADRRPTIIIQRVTPIENDAQQKLL